jgi:mRNA deadenylase 3'-5' endonuclease subunit Ccr4
MTFTVATYNVLASAYIRSEWYPFTPKEFLDPGQRIPALVEHVAALKADIYCLQEVEDETFAALERRFSPLGYHGELARKGGGKPDGCATFLRKDMFELVRACRVEYLDVAAGGENSGHVAQMVVLKQANRTVGIANTHLKWDSSQTQREQQYGYRQIIQLLGECETCAPAGTAWIVCGDLNAAPDSEVVVALRKAGFEFAHHAQGRAYTSNANGNAKTIDYLFYNAALRARPEPLPVIDDHTPLPGPGQPSDHVAVVAQFDWTDLRPSRSFLDTHRSRRLE